jgi:glycosyltransferase involved in cell wall biosynthesis
MTMPTMAVPHLADIKISCLMVTLPVSQRLQRVKASLAAYVAQSHQNKELVVVVNGGTADGRRDLHRYLTALGRDDIRIVAPPGALSLGALRNIALASAKGEVTCQWDDDDLHHPDRLSIQLSALMAGEFEAAYFQEVMQYVVRDRAIYWTNWRATEALAHPGTLMAKSDAPIVYPVDGEGARRGEDLEVALALNQRGGVVRIEGCAPLFVYVSHGANTWNDDHHDMLWSKLAISSGLLRRREAYIRQALSPLKFGSETIEVRGPNGLAFEIAGL